MVPAWIIVIRLPLLCGALVRHKLDESTQLLFGISCVSNQVSSKYTTVLPFSKIIYRQYILKSPLPKAHRLHYDFYAVSNFLNLNPFLKRDFLKVSLLHWIPDSSFSSRCINISSVGTIFSIQVIFSFELGLHHSHLVSLKYQSFLFLLFKIGLLTILNTVEYGVLRGSFSHLLSLGHSTFHKGGINT